MASGARVIVEVQAGVMPGQPEDALTRRWVITSDEWDITGAQTELLATLNGRAIGYAMLLMLSPQRVNWVRTDWLWP
jgi:hypothetical protein